jgi:hypothetical protein
MYIDEYDVSELKDPLNDNNLHNDISICGIDPGRTMVFTAAYENKNGSCQLRRCSTKEYYAYTGSRRHERKQRKRMDKENITDLFLQIPTSKTTTLSDYLLYVTHILKNIKKMFDFNNETTAESRFHLYQGVQRAREELANIIVDGGKKYNRNKRKHTKENRKRRRKRMKNSMNEKEGKKKESLDDSANLKR